MLLKYPWILSSRIQENYEEIILFFTEEKVCFLLVSVCLLKHIIQLIQFMKQVFIELYFFHYTNWQFIQTIHSLKLVRICTEYENGHIKENKIKDNQCIQIFWSTFLQYICLCLNWETCFPCTLGIRVAIFSKSEVCYTVVLGSCIK